MTDRNAPLAGKALDRFTRKSRLMIALAQRASRRRKGLIDRLVTRVLDRATRPGSPEDDFMRDEIVDAGIGFSAEELEAYSRGEGSKSIPLVSSPPAIQPTPPASEAGSVAQRRQQQQ